MPSYLIIAYGIFVTFPLALAAFIYLRRQRVEHRIEELEKQKT